MIYFLVLPKNFKVDFFLTIYIMPKSRDTDNKIKYLNYVYLIQFGIMGMLWVKNSYLQHRIEYQKDDFNYEIKYLKDDLKEMRDTQFDNKWELINRINEENKNLREKIIKLESDIFKLQNKTIFK